MATVRKLYRVMGSVIVAEGLVDGVLLNPSSPLYPDYLMNDHQSPFRRMARDILRAWGLPYIIGKDGRFRAYYLEGGEFDDPILLGEASSAAEAAVFAQEPVADSFPLREPQHLVKVYLDDY